MSSESKSPVTRQSTVREFYVHLGIYLSVMIGLFLINLAVSPGAWWFLYAAGGWGIGVGIHGVAVFVAADSDAIDELGLPAANKTDGHLRSQML